MFVCFSIRKSVGVCDGRTAGAFNTTNQRRLSMSSRDTAKGEEKMARKSKVAVAVKPTFFILHRPIICQLRATVALTCELYGRQPFKTKPLVTHNLTCSRWV
jgi:hypothetical protein